MSVGKISQGSPPVALINTSYAVVSVRNAREILRDLPRFPEVIRGPMVARTDALMRHRSIETTLKHYVGRDSDELAARLSARLEKSRSSVDEVNV